MFGNQTLTVKDKYLVNDIEIKKIKKTRHTFSLNNI